jgi:hypothetical protein
MVCSCSYSVHLGEFLLKKELEEPKVELGENYLSQHKKYLKKSLRKMLKTIYQSIIEHI